MKFVLFEDLKQYWWNVMFWYSGIVSDIVMGLDAHLGRLNDKYDLFEKELSDE